MDTRFLFPYGYKKYGWVLLALGIVLGAVYLADTSGLGFLELRVPALLLADFDLTEEGERGFRMVENNWTDELAAVLIIVGGLLAGFSRCREEDEYIVKLRSESLTWAFYVNYLILLVAVLLTYDLTFLWVLIFNMFTPLFIYLLRFHWVLYRERKSYAGYEEQVKN